MSRKILITGSTGFLAGYLIKELEKRVGSEIYGITDEAVADGSIKNTFRLDIRDREGVFKLVRSIKPDIVFHLAAITNVGFSWKNQKLTHEVNFLGSLNLLEALCENNLMQSKVLMMSSAEVYGNSPETITEKTALSIENPYSLSKFAMEMLADIFIKSNGMNIVKVRSFNFTGPGQDKKFVSSDFACQISEIEKKRRSPVINVGNLSAERDFSDVRDIARYIEVISRLGISGESYNLCSGKTLSIQEILDMLISLSDEKISINISKEKFRPVDIPVLRGDNSYLKEKFDLSPQFELKDTLISILDYWRNKQDE